MTARVLLCVFACTAFAPQPSPVTPALYQDLKWRNVGPTRGGRVTAFAGVRTQPCTFYMGATGGGIWKTENCGGNWTPTSDGQIETGSIGAIDVSESHPDIVWAGTGSAAIRSNVIIGRGVYKSVDAGRRWLRMGLEDAGQIGGVVIHPSNPDVVWVAALGSPFGPNDQRGIFKTRDGGRTWTRTLFVNDTTGGRALAINYANPDELYAGMYRGFRKGWDVISGGPASEGGIYKSLDGGATWKKLSNGLPGGLIGKIDIDVARSRPRTVYAMIEAPGDEGGLYRSDDGGETWRNVNNASALRLRPFYFNYVDVNPKDAEDVWVSALLLHRSRDGGRTFSIVQTPHADNHGVWFNPDNPAYAIQGNDGGAAVTIDGARTWSSILNQPTAELYMVSVDEQHPYLLYAPQQDNSTVVVPSVPTVGFGADHPAQWWTQASGCETGGIWPSPDGRIIWGACKGEVERFNVETGQAQGRWIYPQNRYGHHPAEIKYRFPRQTVIMLSPHDPQVVYQASHVLHRSRDEGLTWEVISPDLTANEPEFQIVSGNPITRDVTGEEVYSSIYAMDESPIERGVLWVGANDGPVHVTRDDGKTWRNVTPKGLPPGGRVQTVAASPHRKGSAYVAVYRFLREHDLQPYIYRTDDYGTTWTKLTTGENGIPRDHPTRVVREDPERPGLLYAGTEFAIFVSFDNGGRWHSLQQNLPATPVTDIRVHRGDLVIATMGRSFWIMDDIAPLRRLMQPIGDDLTLVEPSPRVRYRRAASAPGAGPAYPPVALAIDYLLPAGFTQPLSLEIRDATGRIVHAAKSGTPEGTEPSGNGGQAMGTGGGGRGTGGASLTARAGHNRYLWDYRWRDGGPLAAPGTYRVHVGAAAAAFEVRVDPGVLSGGTTVADLVSQQEFLLEVADARRGAERLRDRIRTAMNAAGIEPPAPPGPGESIAPLRYPHALQGLWSRVVTAPGPYQQGMLIDQLSNVIRAEGGADQKVGSESRRRLADLKEEMRAIEVALRRVEAGGAGAQAGAGGQVAPLVAEEVFTAQVVSVEDGDTIVVKGAAEQTTVHLANVDAPELSQPAGPAAREFLRRLVRGGTVTVRLINVLERLARIEVSGSDVALALVGAGMAWHCPRYTEDRALIAAEAEARREKRGLWRAARPTPPWLHRGAGMCWEQGKAASPQDFSGVWTAVSPSERAGAQLVIRQDVSTLTLERPGGTDGQAVTYKLEGAVSRLQRNDEGRLIDALARTWWTGRALVIEERSWPVHGQESVQSRQVLWIDDRGLLNVEESSPQPIGRSNARTVVLRRDAR